MLWAEDKTAVTTYGKNGRLALGEVYYRGFGDGEFIFLALTQPGSSWKMSTHPSSTSISLEDRYPLPVTWSSMCPSRECPLPISMLVSMALCHWSTMHTVDMMPFRCLLGKILPMATHDFHTIKTPHFSLLRSILSPFLSAPCTFCNFYPSLSLTPDNLYFKGGDAVFLSSMSAKILNKTHCPIQCHCLQLKLLSFSLCWTGDKSNSAMNLNYRDSSSFIGQSYDWFLISKVQNWNRHTQQLAEFTRGLYDLWNEASHDKERKTEGSLHCLLCTNTAHHSIEAQIM